MLSDDRHITIGIAGHVDHGKSTLVRCLTNIDPDRMKEEKRRGLSIEFGIAPLVLHSGTLISLVDVPGHTDYMKNTIRGLSAVDAAILVVAADDGVMPQTREHFEILRFLGLNAGLVVLSKTDLVDSDTIELASLEVHDLVQGSFLEACPIIPFSGTERRGREALAEALEILTRKAASGKNPGRPFRMFIDQVRTFQGLGTVVSGTILSGRVNRGGKLEILPSGRTAKVRSLETHHSNVETASAGCRVGINLQGTSSHEISRGMVLAEPGTSPSHRFLNVELGISPFSARSLRTGQRIKVYLGTALTGALVVIMDGDELAPGCTGFVQLRTADLLPAIPGDRYVITPMNSPAIIGGGRVLEATNRKFRRTGVSVMIPLMEAFLSADPGRIVEAFMNARPEAVLSAESLNGMTGLGVDRFDEVLLQEASAGNLTLVGECAYLSAASVQSAKDHVAEFVEKTLMNETDKDHVSLSHISSSLGYKPGTPVMDIAIEVLVREGSLVAVKGGYTTRAFSERLASSREHMTQMVLALVEESEVSPVTVATVWEKRNREQDRQEVRKVLEYLHTRGKIVRLGNDRYLSRKGLDIVKHRVAGWISEHGCITAADCGAVLGYGRTSGIPVLEYLDAVGFTERRGNERVLSGKK